MTYRQVLDEIAADQILLPLSAGRPVAPEFVTRLRKETPFSIFAGSYSPEGAMCGVWLRYQCWDDAHSIAQDLNTPEGSYWHGVIHRMEPDSWNSNYWFRQAGKHKIFPALRNSAARLCSQRPGAGFSVGDEWKPGEFIGFCEEARKSPDSEANLLAREIQMAEWWLLFEYCARRGL